MKIKAPFRIAYRETKYTLEPNNTWAYFLDANGQILYCWLWATEKWTREKWERIRRR